MMNAGVFDCRVAAYLNKKIEPSPFPKRQLAEVGLRQAMHNQADR